MLLSGAHIKMYMDPMQLWQQNVITYGAADVDSNTLSVECADGGGFRAALSVAYKLAIYPLHLIILQVLI
jgi:hypothetical protein